MNRSDIRLLIVDDEAGFRQLLADILGDEGFRVEVSGDPRDALRAFEREPADLVLTDIKMPGMDGLQFFAAIRKLDAEVPVIILTGYATTDLAIEALRLGAFNFIRKPFQAAEILAVVRKAVKMRRLIWRKREALARLEPRQKLTIASDPELVEPTVYCLLEAVTAVRPLPAGVELDLAAALSEALTNAIRHGNRFDPDRQVSIELGIEGDLLRVRIEDEGEGFDPAAQPDPTAPGRILSDTGRGLLMMRYYMDGVQTLGRGNVLEMTKRLGPPRPAAESDAI